MSSRHDDQYRRRGHHDRRSRERRRSRSREERRHSRSRDDRRRDRDRSRDKNRDRDRSRERRERRRDERRRSRERPQDKSRRESRKSPQPPTAAPRERSKSIDKLISEDNSRSSATSEYISEVLTEEQRQKIHEQTIARLEKLKKEQPKRLEPSRPSHATIFINDGSFLETFKQMQQQYQEQGTTAVQPRPEEQLAQLPCYARRRGGKILKTGIVEKQKTTSNAEPAKDAWSLYLQEVKRYKNATCDADASRALVK